MDRRKLGSLSLFGLLVAVGVASRLAVLVCPLVPPNFHAIVGTTLFAGFLFASRAQAAAVALSAMLLSDLVLGAYEPLVMITVYASLVAPIVWRAWLRRDLSATRVAATALASSLLFYATTNLAVWHAWYPHTWAGFARCFTAALPFLLYSVCGDLLFAAGLFGAYALAVRESEPLAGPAAVRIHA